MRILITHDGSESSDAAIDDLKRAGLPEVAEVSVLCVAEFVPRVPDVSYAAMAAGTGYYVPMPEDEAEYGSRHLEEAQSCASRVAGCLSESFPHWHVETEAWIDNPKLAIVRKTHGWHPDLIVMGSHGRSGFRRFALGSVCQYVLHHTNCSMRIGRRHLHPADQPIRLLIGSDGSAHAKSAVLAVATRQWPVGTEARVVGVMDSLASPTMPAVTPVDEYPPAAHGDYRGRMSEALREDVADLTKAGLRTTYQVRAGSPAEVLTAEAEEWGADCIFIGARDISAVERLLTGSVSTMVALHAHCSVEVVR